MCMFCSSDDVRTVKPRAEVEIVVQRWPRVSTANVQIMEISGFVVRICFGNVWSFLLHLFAMKSIFVASQLN